MPDTITPGSPVATATNGVAHVTPRRPATSTSRSPVTTAPRSRLLAKLTSLTTIAAVAAAGMMLLGILALVGGSYTEQVVHDQLAPQKIFFPAAASPALLPGIKQYAGQQLLTG